MPPAETATAPTTPTAAHALVLNSDFRPLKIVEWRDAILLLLDQKADLVEEYVGKLVRSASAAMPWPAVIQLRKYVETRIKMRFSRMNVLARDGFQCCYCGVKPTTRSGRPDTSSLTMDHVIPRAQSRDGKVVTAGGRRVPTTGWSNIVTACVDCNARKADRTPEQAKMPLLRPPRVPGTGDVLVASMRRVSVPAEWAGYLAA